MSGRLDRIQNLEQLARDAGFQPWVLAALCVVSLRQLERFFQQEFKTTPGQWLKTLKCRLALDLVKQGWSNKAVVAELGFGNESHLCHEFKRIYGVPPQTFAPRYRPVRKAENIASKQQPHSSTTAWGGGSAEPNLQATRRVVSLSRPTGEGRGEGHSSSEKGDDPRVE